jgi:serine/threonine protein kinase
VEGSSTEFLPGNLVGGKYLVEGNLGEGGLAVVVKARHVQLEQSVAIKYLKPLALSQPGVVDRFLREARLAARIKSEHAVKVHDVGTLPSGIPYMVMELLEGRDLGQLLAEGPLTIPVAIDYLLQATEALAEAHAAGIVHRDLKPDNLFLADRPGSPVVKVLDFGISKAASKKSDGRRDKIVTQVNDRFGTPVFMSPEQLESSANVDARADIWALGVVLYELVTGKLPFEGDELPQLCTSILTKPPIPVRSVLPSAPPELEAILGRCLEKDREKRYRNVAEFAQDLVQLWDHEPPSRIKQIAQVIRNAGQSIRPPTPFPGSIRIEDVVQALGRVHTPNAPTRPAASPPAAPAVDPSAALETSAESVIAVFMDAYRAKIDELNFVSLEEAYEYCCSLKPPIVRCEVYDEFAGARGKHRVTYLRKSDTGHWMPVLE